LHIFALMSRCRNVLVIFQNVDFMQFKQDCNMTKYGFFVELVVQNMQGEEKNITFFTISYLIDRKVLTFFLSLYIIIMVIKVAYFIKWYAIL